MTDAPLLDRLGGWVLTELPRFNRAILARTAEPASLREELRHRVLPELPHPDTVDPDEARRLVVLLGLVGASIARHHQGADPGARDHPERGFDGLGAGTPGIDFRAYFAALADRTGTGHCPRDGYASLVRWNVDTTEVRWDGALASLDGSFDDGEVRSYTGTLGERRFFELIKMGEAIELCINGILEPLSASVALTSVEGRDRIRSATTLLEVLRRLFVDFANLAAHEAMTPTFFMDVFRQFAVHWTPGDIPPSGALDPEAIRRDLQLGIAFPGYLEQIRRLYPGLLTTERAMLEETAARPSLSVRLPTQIGLDLGALAGISSAGLLAIVRDHPALGDMYLLLTGHGRAAGAHLSLTKRFLFRPQHHREAAGQGDEAVVSNRRGTTGMDEPIMERLTRARANHALSALRAIPRRVLVDALGWDPTPAAAQHATADVIRFVQGGRPIRSPDLPAVVGHV